MTPEREADIRAMHAARMCGYVGRCDDGGCSKHGGEARAMADLLAEIDRLRALAIAVTGPTRHGPFGGGATEEQVDALREAVADGLRAPIPHLPADYNAGG